MHVHLRHEPTFGTVNYLWQVVTCQSNSTKLEPGLSQRVRPQRWSSYAEQQSAILKEALIYSCGRAGAFASEAAKRGLDEQEIQDRA